MIISVCVRHVQLIAYNKSFLEQRVVADLVLLSAMVSSINRAYLTENTKLVTIIATVTKTRLTQLLGPLTPRVLCKVHSLLLI
jgi:hypothetical protein